MNERSKTAALFTSLAVACLIAWFGGSWLWGRALAMHGGARPAGSTPKVTSVSWPATRAGSVARGWVDAFSAGEAAMREFTLREVARESLEERGVEERIASYRKLRSKLGVLRLKGIVQATPDEIEALLTAGDGTEQRFVFNIQKEAPYKLVSVKLFETRSGHGH